jgi:hypothetical protein
MKSQVRVRYRRRILCVFPRYAPSFGTFHHAYPLMDGVRAFMPPQGILVVAAYLPEAWEVRLVDENIRPACKEELAWADAVFVSGMHVQKGEINAVARRARALGKTTVLGGSSVSASPEQYPEFDYLHLGEIGDATDALIRAIDEDIKPPSRQRRFATNERLPLADFPIPAYGLIESRTILLAVSNSRAAALIAVSSVIFPHFTGVSRGSKPRSRSSQSSTRCSPLGSRPRSISSTTISSATRRRRASCCHISSPGKSATAIHCNCAARRPSTSPNAPIFWR